MCPHCAGRAGKFGGSRTEVEAINGHMYEGSPCFARWKIALFPLPQLLHTYMLLVNVLYLKRRAFAPRCHEYSGVCERNRRGPETNILNNLTYHLRLRRTLGAISPGV